MSPRIIWIIVIVVLVVVLAVVGMIAAGVFAIFGIMDRTDAHVCAMEYVRKSDVAADLVGTPIVQKGMTGGSSNTSNGETNEHITFTVSGPKGEAMVVADGTKSGVQSHLTVRIGREGEGRTVYDGKFDCSALHAAK